MNSVPQQSFIKRHRMLIAIAVLILLIIGWWFSAYPRGMLVAWIDQARGHHEMQVYGLPAPWSHEYAQLLKSGYGVEIHAVAGCVVTNQLVSFVDGYNAVSVSRIEARFGKDIFAECADEARIAWEREHAHAK
jgi:hypothetical protein